MVAEELLVFPKLLTRITIPAPRRRTPATARSPIPISDVHLRDLLDPERADEHEKASEDEGNPADERMEHRLQVVTAREREREQHEERKSGEDPARDLRLRR